MRSKGLFRVTMAPEGEPNAATEKIKWHNGRDEAYGLLCLSISRDLVFRVNGLTSPNEVWEKLQTLFGKIDETRGHELENDLVSLLFRTLHPYNLGFGVTNLLLDLQTISFYRIWNENRKISWLTRFMMVDPSLVFSRSNLLQSF